MKVTTDACLFGAIAAKEISEQVACQVLDIGAGTGLLSLMLAQENDKAVIDTIEIEEAACGQAKENVEASPWSNNVKILQGDILTYQPSSEYNFIISNPPFYERQLNSPLVGRQLAHHSSSLSLQQLFQKADELLKNPGKFLVLLPFYRVEEAVSLAMAAGLFAEKRWQIRQTPKHNFFRTIICFSRENSELKETLSISIRDEDNSYSKVFTELLQPFYLYL